MSDDYSENYNSLMEIDDDMYLVQDGDLFESPMYRDIEDVLECERDAVQEMLGEYYEE